MKTLLLAASLLATSASAIGYVPPVRSTTTNTTPGGTGSDFAQIGLDRAFEDYFTNGHYFLTFNLVRQELVNYRLPNLVAEYKCDFRPEGGQLGSYRPKAVMPAILLGHNASGVFLFRAGDFRVVEPTSHVVKNVRVMNQVNLGWRAKEYLAYECSSGTGTRRVGLTFSSIGMCRWAREDWFKPGHFPIEYQLPDHPHLSRQVRLNCVR